MVNIFPTEANWLSLEKETTYMCRYQCKELRLMKNQVNMTPPKETNKAPITDPKEMEIHELYNQ